MNFVLVVAVMISCGVLYETSATLIPPPCNAPCLNPKLALYQKFPLCYSLKAKLCKRVCDPLKQVPLCPTPEPPSAVPCLAAPPVVYAPAPAPCAPAAPQVVYAPAPVPCAPATPQIVYAPAPVAPVVAVSPAPAPACLPIPPQYVPAPPAYTCV
ncbi:anther-specific proline-rich protein APG-like [Sitophilus oryzae]|uniref:Anther-specific proline-rich protein APG-like n=1 Tax=Sitophilus oryzae TaxID=7048 RepID=A0A6J2YNZ5_SITOR|nr:anther-specific proline-rich protein APG-like [Sitophilus oryzae]